MQAGGTALGPTDRPRRPRGALVTASWTHHAAPGPVQVDQTVHTIRVYNYRVAPRASWPARGGVAGRPVAGRGRTRQSGDEKPN